MSVFPITVILTQYKRKHLHSQQVAHIKAQSVPTDIICWCNSVEGPIERCEGVSYIQCDRNWKFHARFSLALCAQTTFVAVIDDDVMPGPRWLETCLLFAHKGLIGASGSILTGPGYLDHNKVGYLGKKIAAYKEVDIVGGAWFFKKNLVRSLFQEEPMTWENGEDIHFAASLKLLHNIPCFVTPYPEDSVSCWGCLPQFVELGKDAVATSVAQIEKHYYLRDEIVKFYRLRGWKPLLFRGDA